MKANKLPDLPSDLILVALADLEAVERSKRYNINVNEWHKPVRFSNTCAVCFAGSVIAKTLKTDPTTTVDPFSFDGDTADKLSALNSFRQGFIKEGLLEMQLAPTDLWESVVSPGSTYNDDQIFPVPPYSKKNAKQFKAALMDIAGILKSEGL